LEVERTGIGEPLVFEIEPEKDAATGLLGIGISPGRSNRLYPDNEEGTLAEGLDLLGIGEAGVEPGMELVTAADTPIYAYEQLEAIVSGSEGRPVPSMWTAVDEEGLAIGAAVKCDLPVVPNYEILRYPAAIPDIDQNAEEGLFGLTPLIRIAGVNDGRHNNIDVLAAGDIILRAGSVDGPRMAQLRSELARRKGGEIDLVVLRDGAEQTVTADVDRKGMLNVAISLAWDLPYVAQPMNRLRTPPGPDGKSEIVDAPVAELLLMGRSRIDAVGGEPVSDWRTIREAVRSQTASAAEAGTGARLSLTVSNPTPGQEQETLEVAFSADDVRSLAALSWLSQLRADVFEPRYTMLSSDGNPVRAAIMGFEETHKVIVMTYLTIDRLVRGSVGVEQIRGPVGIVHIGAQLAGRGAMYLLFFLGIISVNLAVINFLPIPIVDGGLFLFLIYEKLKGRPPSLVFQNTATIIGLALIATVFIVVTWNDLVRLLG
jgi:regulator of sigma E protease